MFRSQDGTASEEEMGWKARLEEKPRTSLPYRTFDNMTLKLQRRLTRLNGLWLQGWNAADCYVKASRNKFGDTQTDYAPHDGQGMYPEVYHVARKHKKLTVA